MSEENSTSMEDVYNMQIREIHKIASANARDITALQLSLRRIDSQRESPNDQKIDLEPLDTFLREEGSPAPSENPLNYLLEKCGTSREEIENINKIKEERNRLEHRLIGLRAEYAELLDMKKEVVVPKGRLDTIN